jgi:poly(A) polymerase
MRIFQLSQLNEITERAINRFIKDVDEVSLEVIFLAVADIMATGTRDTCASTIESVNNLAAVLIDRIFSPNHVLEKDALITGSEVMNILSIPEGPEVGNILREISERERTGVFKSREDAIKWIMEKKKPH